MALPMAQALTIAQEATGIESFPAKPTASAIMSIVDLAYEYGRLNACQHEFVRPSEKDDAVCIFCGKKI